MFEIKTFAVVLFAIVIIATLQTMVYYIGKGNSKSTLSSLSFLDCNKYLVEDIAGCFAYIARYNWNNKLQQCVEGIYGGCHPSTINFEDLETREVITRKYYL